MKLRKLSAAVSATALFGLMPQAALADTTYDVGIGVDQCVQITIPSIANKFKYNDTEKFKRVETSYFYDESSDGSFAMALASQLQKIAPYEAATSFQDQT